MNAQHPPLVLWIAAALWATAHPKRKFSKTATPKYDDYIMMAANALMAEDEWANGVADEHEIQRLVQEFAR